MLPLLTCAFILGVAAGLRAFTPLAAVSLAAAQGWLGLNGTWLALLGVRYAPCVAGALALLELVGDKLPQTPSRKVPLQFGTRLLSGAVCGAAIGLPAGLPLPAAALGIAGAITGTLGGAKLRTKLAKTFKKDLPAALLEDAITIALTATVILSLKP